MTSASAPGSHQRRQHKGNLHIPLNLTIDKWQYILPTLLMDTPLARPQHVSMADGGDARVRNVADKGGVRWTRGLDSVVGAVSDFKSGH